MATYVHKEIGKDVRFISGYYEYLEELQLDFKGRQVLCAVGLGVLDNSCCGRGGCYFIEVPGYIVSWKSGTNQNGLATSEVTQMEDADERKNLTKELQNLYPMAQVNFS